MSEASPLRIIWLRDGPYVATEPVQLTTSINASTQEPYEHDVAACSCKVVRKATADEVQEWRIRE